MHRHFEHDHLSTDAQIRALEERIRELEARLQQSEEPRLMLWYDEGLEPDGPWDSYQHAIDCLVSDYALSVGDEVELQVAHRQPNVRLKISHIPDEDSAHDKASFVVVVREYNDD